MLFEGVFPALPVAFALDVGRIVAFSAFVMKLTKFLSE
jgi:hypothetical protein